VAIHFDPVNEETSCSRSPRHDGLPRRHWGCLLAMTIFCSLPFLTTFVIARM